MSLPSLRSVERELARPGTDPVALLTRFRHPRHRAAWERNPRLFLVFSRRLLAVGLPNRAFDLLRDAVDIPDPGLVDELTYLRALALARGGNDGRAEEIAAALLRRRGLEEGLRVEALSLLGRIHKDRYQRAEDATIRRSHARTSARRYLQAFDLTRDPFPGINTALMHLLAGSRRRATELAQDVLVLAEETLRTRRGQRDPWAVATRAEARLLSGDFSGAAADYTRAQELAEGDLGRIVTMRRNVLLLHGVCPVPREVLDVFRVGVVVVFSGHMVDPPGRPRGDLGRPRYPDDVRFERRLRRALRRELASLDARVGVCSGACGGDLLFAEEVLRAGGELHVVLPFDREDFLDTSVDLGHASGPRWRRRFEKVLAKAFQVHHATSERSLGDHTLFAFTNTFQQGLASMRARQLNTDAVAMVAHDPTSAGGSGGAGDFLCSWRDAGLGEVQEIDLRTLRGDVEWPVPGPPRRGRAPVRAMPSSPEREIKALLFADVKGFSKITEEQCPSFFVNFLDHVAAVLAEAPTAPDFQNTWGDGLFLVFDQVADCADLALRLVEMVERTDWTAHGLPADLTLRLGLHAGPVFSRCDPILRQQNFFGSHVNRAARLEPVTAPGCAYTTETFAGILEVEAQQRFRCEYVGIETLAKDFDTAPVFRLLRRG